MMLKGPFSCILTIGDGETTVEWLRGQTNEPIRVFRSETESCLLHGGAADLPADEIVAAGIGKDLHTRGQVSSFDWDKAMEYLRISECSSNRPPISKRVFEALPVEPAKEDPPAPKPSESYICPCRSTPKPMVMRPFPQHFPESEWIRHDYPSPNGSWHYLTGTIYRNGSAIASATAVPGKYSARPPSWLKEFSLYLNCPENRQGYWVAVTPVSLNSIKTEET